MIARRDSAVYGADQSPSDSYDSLIQSMVASSAEQVNRTWQNYQTASVAGDKERQERDESVQSLLNWIQSWRPVLLLLVPGAETNLRQLPPTGATPDAVRVAENMADQSQILSAI